MNISNTKIRVLIKILIGIFVFGGIIIGGLAQAVAPSLDPQFGEKMHKIYLVFENFGRSFFIFAATILTFIFYKNSNKKMSMRETTIICFSISMFIFFIVLPLVSSYWEFVHCLMPFPWSTFPLQILADGHYFSQDVTHLFNGNGVFVLVSVYIAFNILAFVGVFILGRRWFCSMVCGNVGGHAETFKIGAPMLAKGVKKWSGKNRGIYYRILAILKWSFLSINILLVIMWIFPVFLDITIISYEILRIIELVKYMVFELFLMLISFVLINGRMYCNYCPAGTFLGIIGTSLGQRIETNQSSCVSCGKCNEICDMGIDIKTCAQKGVAVKSYNCVGCGACVDECPTKTLMYKVHGG